jgi:hypothetical protein
MHAARSIAALALFTLTACAPAVSTTTVTGSPLAESTAELPPHLLPSIVIEGDERAALVAGLTDLMARLEDRRATSASARRATDAESLAPVCLEFWTLARPARTVPDSTLLRELQAATVRRVLPRTQCVTTPRPVTSVAAASGGAGLDDVQAPATTPQEVLVSAWRYESASAARFQAIAWYGREGRRYECAMAPVRSRTATRWGAACEFRGLQIL